MDIPPGGALPRELPALPNTAPAPPLPPRPLEALVISAQPGTRGGASWQLELDIGGERVRVDSATAFAAGTRILLRAVAADRLRVERVVSEPPPAHPIGAALRSALPVQLPLRDALRQIAALANDPALPPPVRERLQQLFARLPDPAALQQAAVLRAAVLNSGSFLEARLRQLATPPSPPGSGQPGGPGAAASRAPAGTTAGVAAVPEADQAGPGLPGSAAAPAPLLAAYRQGVRMLLRMLGAGSAPGRAPGPAPAAASFPPAPRETAPATPAAGPLYDGRGAVRTPGASPAPAIAADATLPPPGVAVTARTPPGPAPTSGQARSDAMPAAGAMPPAPADRATAAAEPGQPAAAARPPSVAARTIAAAGPGAPTPPHDAPPAPEAAAAASRRPVAALPAGNRSPATPPQGGAPGTPGRRDGAVPAGNIDADVGADFKAQMLGLQDLLSRWLQGRPPAPGASHAGARHALYNARGIVSEPPPGADAADLAAVALPERAAARESALTPAADASPRHAGDVVEALMRYVMGALARTRVHQLSTHPEGRRSTDPAVVQAWSVEIPVAERGRFDGLEMLIEEQQGPSGPRGALERVWQVAMSLEIAPLGPLHALLRLSGTRLATTLWVERETTLAAARSALHDLGECLRAEGVEVTRLECMPGAPPPRSSAHDRLLDIRT
jgi:hypothetical protein